MTRTFAFAAAFTAIAAGAAQAGEPHRAKIDVVSRPSYDARLEQAAIRIVAGRIGDIRGRVDIEIGAAMIAEAELERLIDERIASGAAGVDHDTIVSSIIAR